MKTDKIITLVIVITFIVIPFMAFGIVAVVHGDNSGIILQILAVAVLFYVIIMVLRYE